MQERLLARLDSKITLNLDGTENISFSAPRGTAKRLEECELFGIEVEISIKPYHKRRSLDANALAWVLIDKLAQRLRISKAEVYRQTIRDIGGVSFTVCVPEKAVASLCDKWETNGLGWQAEAFASKIEGCRNVTLYYGSSTYDSEQMSQLIDHLMQDCEALGIPTATPEQIEEALKRWGKEGKKHE